uniref:hypothetical protein n=1 Tax=Vibrio variabilis TaxID=990271 RepID=UPI0013A702AE
MKKTMLALTIAASFGAMANQAVVQGDWTEDLALKADYNAKAIAYSQYIEDDATRGKFLDYVMSGKTEQNRSSAADLVKALKDDPNGEAYAKQLSKFYVKSKWNEAKGEYEAQDFMSSVIADAASTGQIDKNEMITFNGETKSFGDWAKLAQANRTTDYDKAFKSNKEFDKDFYAPTTESNYKDIQSVKASGEAAYNEGVKAFASQDQRLKEHEQIAERAAQVADGAYTELN